MRRLLGCTLFATVTLALPFTAVAHAAAPEPPQLTIKSPAPGSEMNNPTPTVRGTTSGESQTANLLPITLQLYAGPTASGEPARTLTFEPGELNTEWAEEVSPALPAGTYTARAEESVEEAGTTSEPGKSNEVTFTIATRAPAVTITYPSNGATLSGASQLITGSADTHPRDIQSVTVEVFAGATTPRPPAVAVVSAIITPSSEGGWAEVFALAPGTYTARATQRDKAGNVGISLPDTFTLTGPPPRRVQPPAASFTWLPAAPAAGQEVALVSSSTDALSTITTFAWDLAGNGPFKAGGPVLTTSFATPGSHVVRLLVADALGASSVVAASIPIGQPPLKLMQPFPIVRIGGVETGSGVHISSLVVQAPVGVRVTVTCTGHGCRRKSQSAQASTTAHNRRGNSVVLSFPRFARFFRAGVTLEVRVLAAGEIGKYTRFRIRLHSLPSRVDQCLSGLNPKPIACPA